MKRKAEGGIVKGQLRSEIKRGATHSRSLCASLWAIPDVNLRLRPSPRIGSSVEWSRTTHCFGQFLDCAVDRKFWSEIHFPAFLFCRAIHFKFSSYEL